MLTTRQFEQASAAAAALTSGGAEGIVRINSGKGSEEIRRSYFTLAPLAKSMRRAAASMVTASWPRRMSICSSIGRRYE